MPKDELCVDHFMIYIFMDKFHNPLVKGGPILEGPKVAKFLG